MQTRKLLTATLIAAMTTFGLAGCDVDVEEEGELPEIEVKEGNMPEVEVTGPDVEVGTEEKTIEVPDIDVDLPEEDEQ